MITIRPDNSPISVSCQYSDKLHKHKYLIFLSILVKKIRLKKSAQNISRGYTFEMNERDFLREMKLNIEYGFTH